MNPTKMPNFLARFQEKILKTGKYLSVIRECGKVIKKPVFNTPTMIYSTDERNYEARIELAYQSASRQLLQLLIEDSNLIGHLKSIKHYFFMDQGDWVVQFMDIASKELSSEVYSIDEMQLRALIELSLRTSVSKSDPNHENIGIELQSNSLLSEMFNVCCIGDGQVMEDDKVLRGFESIALTYNVKWPLNIILSTCNIGRYQMLFRHLFLCKFVERQLEAVWKTNQYVKLLALKTAQNYAEAFSLTQKMLNFVQNLSYFMMVEVIEPNFVNFITKIDSHSQVDELAKEHTSFVEGCLEGCLLSQKSTTQLMITLLDLCVQFADFMKENGKIASSYELQKRSTAVNSKVDGIKKNLSKVTIREETSINGQVLSFEDEVRIHHDKFTSILLGLLQEIQNLQADNFSGNINHILYRLDYNEYYDQLKNENDRMIESGNYSLSGY